MHRRVPAKARIARGETEEQQRSLITDSAGDVVLGFDSESTEQAGRQRRRMAEAKTKNLLLLTRSSKRRA